MEDKIYPGLDNQYDFHLAEIKQLRDQIKDDIITFTKKRDQYKTSHKIASEFNIGGGTISVTAEGSCMAALVGGITTPLAILGCISLGAVAITALSTYTMNNYSKGREKYSRLIEIANAVFKRINDTISEALKIGYLMRLNIVGQQINMSYTENILELYINRIESKYKVLSGRIPEVSKVNLR